MTCVHPAVTRLTPQWHVCRGCWVPVVTLVDVVSVAFGESRTKARTLIAQGAVKVDGERIVDAGYAWAPSTARYEVADAA